MSRIRSSGSKMERTFALLLKTAEIRFSTRYNLMGKPDFVLAEYRIAIFCDSRFWHGYRWSRKSALAFRVNREFWIKKIEGNRKRDKEVTKELTKQGWKVLRFWDHQIKQSPGICLSKIREAIKETS